MSLEEMNRNDQDAIIGILEGRDIFCARCGMRTRGKIWRTCVEWDKSHLCEICDRENKGFEPEEDQHRFDRCYSCNMTMYTKGLCSNCLKSRCPKHRNHYNVMQFIKDEQIKEITTCTDCRYWKERNPKDWDNFFNRPPLTERQKLIKQKQQELFTYGKWVNRDGENFFRKIRKGAMDIEIKGMKSK